MRRDVTRRNMHHKAFAMYCESAISSTEKRVFNADNTKDYSKNCGCQVAHKHNETALLMQNK